MSGSEVRQMTHVLSELNRAESVGVGQDAEKAVVEVRLLRWGHPRTQGER